MEITFDRNQSGCRQAAQIRGLIHLIEHYGLTDRFDQDFLMDLKSTVDRFLSRPEIRQMAAEDAAFFQDRLQQPLAAGIIERIREFFGPGRRERILCKQRIELIERAEHAESTAFEALAESTEVRKELEQAVLKIKYLEQELDKIRTDNQR